MSYLPIRVLGQGAFGMVILARRSSDGRLFAIKKLPPSLSQREIQIAKNEIDILSHLNHGYIINFKDNFMDAETGALCIVMEYADGGDLQDIIMQHKNQHKLFTEEEILKIFIQILLALDYIHQKNIIHRDIKPNNIMLTRNLCIKVADFGISKKLDFYRKTAYTQAGTYIYSAPEIFDEHGYTNKIDIWSLGIVLYELCMLEKPFKNLLSILRKNPPDVTNNYSSNMKTLIKQMLNKDPNFRPSANQILNMPYIRGFLRNHQYLLNPPAPPPPRPPRPIPPPPPNDNNDTAIKVGVWATAAAAAWFLLKKIFK